MCIASTRRRVRNVILATVRHEAPEAAIVEADSKENVLTQIASRTSVRVIFVEAALVTGDQALFLADVRSTVPGAIVVLLVDALDREALLTAIHDGAAGVLRMNDRRAYLTTAVRSILQGSVHYPRDLLVEGPAARSRLVDAVQEGTLTPREREVLALIGEGRNVARIAGALDLSPHTVRVHVTRMMKKLDLRDRSSLMHYAITRSRTPARAVP